MFFPIWLSTALLVIFFSMYYDNPVTILIQCHIKLFWIWYKGEEIWDPSLFYYIVEIGLFGLTFRYNLLHINSFLVSIPIAKMESVTLYSVIIPLLVFHQVGSELYTFIVVLMIRTLPRHRIAFKVWTYTLYWKKEKVDYNFFSKIWKYCI